MPESETLAESFLTKFPSVNSLTPHAILSSGGLLKEFLEWSYETRICAIQKYQVPDESITLFSALCKYGELEDSKSIMTDCSSSVSSGPDSGRFRKRRKYNGSPDKYEIQMNGLLHLEQLNRFTNDVVDPSTVSKLSDSCRSKSPKKNDKFRKPRFCQNDLFDHEQGLDMDMMNPFSVLERYDSQISKGPQALKEIKRSCSSLEDKLSGQKQQSDMPIMNNFNLNNMKNSEILQEDLKGEVIDLTDSPVFDEDFPSIANTMKFSSLMPELEIDSTRKSKAARKLSFDSSSHRTFPTAAEINSSSTVWHSVKDPRKSSQVGANNKSDTDLEHDVFSLRHRNKPLEESFMQRSGGKSQGLHLHENDISHYGGTPLKNVLRSANSQQNTPWTIEFLNRIKEKSRLRQQSLPRDLSGPSSGYLGNVSKVTKRRSPSIIEFFKYQGDNTSRKLPETKRQKRPLQSSSSSKKEKGPASPLTAWTPADKRARQTLSFAMNGSHGLRKKF